MKYLIICILLSPLAQSKIITPYKINSNNGSMFFEVSSNLLKVSCEKSPNTENWFGEISTVKEEQIWFIRRPIGKDDCESFAFSVKKILNDNKTVKILGNAPQDKKGRISSTIYLDAVKGKTACWEWFEGECKEF